MFLLAWFYLDANPIWRRNWWIGCKDSLWAAHVIALTENERGTSIFQLKQGPRSGRCSKNSWRGWSDESTTLHSWNWSRHLATFVPGCEPLGVSLLLNKRIYSDLLIQGCPSFGAGHWQSGLQLSGHLDRLGDRSRTDDRAVGTDVSWERHPHIFGAPPKSWRRSRKHWNTIDFFIFRDPVFPGTSFLWCYLAKSRSTMAKQCWTTLALGERSLNLMGANTAIPPWAKWHSVHFSAVFFTVSLQSMDWLDNLLESPIFSGEIYGLL